MAYKFQIGAARLSGSIIQSDGTGDLRATTVDSLNASNGGIAAAGAIAGATSVDGTGDLTMGTITMTGFSVDADGDTAVKSLELEDDQFISNEGNTQMMQFTADGDILLKDGAFDFDVAAHDGTNGLKLGGTLVAASAAELNLLDAIPQGSIIFGNGSAESARLAAGGANTVLKSNGSDISYGAVVNADIANNAAIALSKLAAGGSAGDMIVAGADPGKAPAYVAMSGDATIATDGELSIGATRVTDAMLNDDVATGLAGAGSTATSGQINVIGGNGITANANDVEVTPTQTTITSVLNAALVVGRDADNKLDFSTDDVIKFNTAGAERMTIGATGDVTVEGNFKVKGTTTTIESTVLKVKDPMIELNVVVGAEGRSSNLGAGLFLSGSSVANDASLILAADGGRFKASGNGANAGFDIQTGGDYRINNASVLNATTLGGAVLNSSLTSVGALAGGSIASGFTKIAVANVLDVLSIDIDGATALGAAVEAADLLIIDDGASGTNRKVTMAAIKTFVETGASPAEAIKDLSGNDDPAEVGINYFSADLSSTQTVALPASATLTVGQKVRIKAPGDCSATVKVVINRVGSQLMDGNLESISLESPFAAVELVYISANAWRIF